MTQRPPKRTGFTLVELLAALLLAAILVTSTLSVIRMINRSFQESSRRDIGKEDRSFREIAKLFEKDLSNAISIEQVNQRCVRVTSLDVSIDAEPSPIQREYTLETSGNHSILKRSLSSPTYREPLSTMVLAADVESLSLTADGAEGTDRVLFAELNNDKGTVTNGKRSLRAGVIWLAVSNPQGSWVTGIFPRGLP
ncbi:prepilin-type N-terminal cleavage/methylation domain-containing protein [bacterium]|nr:prepilin-type N-terminal cleavage/methylation domain-containing protein [bacterium]